MDGKVVIGTELETKSFEAQIRAVERKLNDMIADYETMSKEKGFDEQSHDAVELRKNIEKLSNEYISLTQKQQEVTNKHVFDGIGDSITGVIKKVGKWTLAIFGVRSAYMFIRQAMSTLSQYNEQLATDVEYIRYALATSLQPLIEAIIKLAYQLLNILNSITKNLFGWDMFKNAGANAFKKANKGAKELQKTLAGFDKLNILNENGTTGAVGGVSPSFDLSQMGDADLSGTVKLLDRIKELFDKGFNTIVGNAKKVLIDLGASPEFISAWENTINSIKQAVEGVIDFIVGLVKILVGFLTGDTELVVEGAKQAVTGIKDFIVGLFNFILNIKALTITAIKDGFMALINFVYNAIIKPIGDWFVNLADNMTSAITNGVKNINNWFNKIPEKLQEIKNRAVEIFKNMGIAIGSAVSNAFKNVINAVLARVESTLNKPIYAINSLIGAINSIPGVNIGKLQNFKLPRMAQGGILNMPGRGVDYYGANIAERGPEGVVPLTNKESLETIGRTIAKYTKFDANVTLELEGRILARIMREINADKQFARNGG